MKRFTRTELLFFQTFCTFVLLVCHVVYNDCLLEFESHAQRLNFMIVYNDRFASGSLDNTIIFWGNICSLTTNRVKYTIYLLFSSGMNSFLNIAKRHVFGIIVTIELVVFSVFSTIYYIQKPSITPQVAGVNSSKTTDKARSTKNILQSLQTHIQGISKSDSKSGAENAQLLAYTFTAFDNIFTFNQSKDSGIFAAKKVLDILLPSHKDQHQTWANSLMIVPVTDLTTQETDSVSPLFSKLQKDIKNEDQPTSPPQTPLAWASAANIAPISPKARNWSLWSSDTKKIIQEPSYILSEQVLQASVAKTESIISSITPSQVLSVRFWNSDLTPNNTPFQAMSKIFDETEDLAIQEADFASIFATISQAMTDVYTLSYDAKYTFYTPRPFQSKELPLILSKPNSPSYIGEQAAIGGVFDTLVSRLIPEKSQAFLKTAQELKEVGVWAGVQHEEDNTQGYILGKDISRNLLEKVKK